jgi:hypothetical protein
MKKLFFVLLVPLLFLLARCSKENPPVLPLFQDTFRCKINGKYWQATVPPNYNIISSKTGLVSTLYDPDSLRGSIWLQAYRDTTGELKESLTLSNGINHGGRGRLKIDQVDYAGSKCSSSEDTTANNWIEIVGVDTFKRIVTGMFQGQTLKRSCDSAVITDGYFKLKF